MVEREGDLPRAIREYAEAVRLQPSLSRAQLDLGAVLAQSGRKAAAVPHLKLAAQAADNDVKQIALQLMKEVQ